MHVKQEVERLVKGLFTSLFLLNRKLDRKGFTLVEVSVGLFLIGIVALVTVELGDVQNKLKGKVEFSDMADEMTSFVSSVLSSPGTCKATFSGIEIVRQNTLEKIQVISPDGQKRDVLKIGLVGSRVRLTELRLKLIRGLSYDETYDGSRMREWWVNNEDVYKYKLKVLGLELKFEREGKERSYTVPIFFATNHSNYVISCSTNYRDRRALLRQFCEDIRGRFGKFRFVGTKEGCATVIVE